MTSLHYASLKGHTEVVEVLLNAGATPNSEDWKKNTPLHFASSDGYTAVVEMLLNAKAKM